MRQGGSPTLRWSVGCGAELRRRLLWRDDLADQEPVFRGVACTRLPDGTAVVVCGELDGWVQVWDLVTGEPRGGPITGRRQAGSSRALREVACTQLPDGTPVAVTGGADGVVRVWDLLAGRLRREARADDVYSLACTQLPDGTAITVTGSPKGAVRFWDVATGRPPGRRWKCGNPLPQVACTRLADDTPVAVIGDRETLRVWDLLAGSFRGTPLATDFEVLQLACLRLADGTPLAVVGSNRQADEEGRRYGTVQAWDLATGRRYGRPLTGHGGEITALACTQPSDGTPIAVSVDRYGTVRAWDLASGQAHGPSFPHIGDGPALACSQLPDGTPVLVTAEEDVQVWSLVVEPSPQGLTGPIRTVGCIGLPDGDEVVVTVGREHRRGYTAQLWDAGTGRLRGRLTGHADAATACARMRGGAAVALTPGEATPDGGSVTLWDLTSGDSHQAVLAGHTGEVHILDCLNLHDGTPIVITDEPVRAWEADTGRPYGPPLPVDINWRRALSCLQLPDGTLLVILLDDNENLQAWDLHTGHPHGPPLAGPADEKVDVVASTLLEDGTPVAVAAADHGYSGPGTLRAWDLSAGRPRGQVLHLHNMTFMWALACARLPDGTAIAAAGGDGKPRQTGVVQIWDLASRRKLHEITFPEPVMGLAFTAEHRLVVETRLDVAVYDLL